MPIKIEFDPSYNACKPTFVLATRSGVKLGAIPAHNTVVKDPLNSYTELVFCAYKELDGVELLIWDEIVDFKLVYCVEWDIWFEIKVEIDSGNETIKNITAKSIGEAELSQINLYDIEINTEADIMRDDYSPTILYQSNDTAASLLHRIMEKAPHYKIAHVDSNLATMQRTFSFNGVSIYDAFQEIAKELHCIFIINSGSDEDGNIAREVSVYDLESTCKDCGHRGDFIDACPECGSTNINTGYGEDTTIFVCTDNLADNIRFTTDTDSVKNCFRLVAGDDLMTATIAGCNPNGSGYIWYLSDETKADMSDELKNKLNEYDEKYDYYQDEHKVTLPSAIVNQYNNKVVDQIRGHSSNNLIQTTVVGYPALMELYYMTIDDHLYLEHEMMPRATVPETTASKQAALLTSSNIPSVAVQNLETCSSTTAANAVLGYAKVIIDPRYKIRVNNSTLNTNNTWTGNFIVTSYSDDADSATSPTITVAINDDLEEFTKQKLEKELSDVSEDGHDIVALFKLEEPNFYQEMNKYCLVMLNSFRDACQACLDILIESGAADPSAWEGQDPNLYEELYLPYYKKLQVIDNEIADREAEIAIIIGKRDANGEIITDGLQTVIEREKSAIQAALDFQDFLGDELWLEFAAYRRDDTYQNDNYISDGLDNSELFSNALEFIETAKKEIVRSSTLQHSISATLKNLLVMKEFKPIVRHFQNGNWIRIQVDEDIYRLRLIEFQINYNDLDHIDVEFSDVCKVADGFSDIESILNQAASMATSYDAVVRQAEQGSQVNGVVSEWVSKGLDLTNTKIMNSADNQDVVWDKKGMLFRRYDPVTEEYDDCQLKIINSTLAITDDNWKSVKTALGRYYYVDPETGDEITTYGIIAETVVGSLILGKQLGIYSSNDSLTFDENGLVITDGKNLFQVDPSPDDGILLRLASEDKNVFYIDSEGVLHIIGDGREIDISENATISRLNDRITTIVSGPDGAYTEVTQRLDGIDKWIVDADGNFTNIEERADGIEKTISDVNGDLQSVKSTANGNVTQISNIQGDITTIKENAGAVETRVENAEKEVSVIKQAIDEIDLSVSNGNASASIVLTIGDDKKTGTIDLTGLVKFSDLSSPGSTEICGDNITTGTLNANNIGLFGAFTVKAGNASFDGGKIGYMSGSMSGVPTDGIGISSPNQYKYLIVTDGGVRMQADGYNGDNSASTSFYITKNQVVARQDEVDHFLIEDHSVKLVAEDTALTVSSGKIAASQAVTVDSDRRLKNDINYLTDKFDILYDNLRPVSYRYKRDTSKLHIGFIAQDVADAIKYAGLYSDEIALLSSPDAKRGTYSLAYDEFIALNTYMIQKLMERVDRLENIIR